MARVHGHADRRERSRIGIGECAGQPHVWIHVAGQLHEAADAQHGVHRIERFFKPRTGVGTESEASGRLANGGWMKVGTFEQQ